MNEEQMKEFLNSLEKEALADIEPGVIKIIFANGGFKKLLFDGFVSAKDEIFKIIDEAFLEDYPKVTAVTKEAIEGLMIYLTHKFQKEEEEKDNTNEIKE